MTGRQIFSENWRRDAKPVALGLFLVVVLLAAGCVGQPVSGNTIDKNASARNSATLQTQPVQNPGPPASGIATSYIIINPVINHNVGDVFEINGTTNLGVDTKILFQLSEPPQHGLAPDPKAMSATKTPSYQPSGTMGYVDIQNGTGGTNFWSYKVNLSGYHRIRYYVNVWVRGIKPLIQNWTNFRVSSDQTKILAGDE
jgi:hypothetical protein